MRSSMGVTDEVNRILSSDLGDLDKVMQAFDVITGSVIEAAEREVELSRAMGDRESLIREQIKMETVKHARAILHDCYMQVTRRRTWHE
jgi:hypothetical protein